MSEPKQAWHEMGTEVIIALFRMHLAISHDPNAYGPSELVNDSRHSSEDKAGLSTKKEYLPDTRQYKSVRPKTLQPKRLPVISG